MSVPPTDRVATTTDACPGRPTSGTKSRDTGGVARTWRLAVPTGSTTGVILDLHRLGGSADAHAATTQLERRGTPLGFTVITPDGTLRNAGTRQFWDLADGAFTATNADWLAELARSTAAALCAPDAPVFVSGHSNGAAMATVLACRPDLGVRAIALVSRELAPLDCGDRHVSVLALHGTADPLLPDDGTTASGVHQALAAWARQDGCANPTPETGVEGAMGTRWQGCARGTEVLVLHVTGGGHTWPGSPRPDPDFGPTAARPDATGLALELFADRADGP